MKIFILSLILLLIPTHSFANDAISCDDDQGKGCKVFIKRTNVVDEVSYQVQLWSADNNNALLSGREENTTMEDISLLKINDTYLLQKMSVNFSKTLEAISFRLKNNRAVDVNYYLIDSSINVAQSKREWYGYRCQINESYDKGAEESSIFYSLSRPCKKSLNKINKSTKVIGDDIFFSMNKASYSNAGQTVKVVALDTSSDEQVFLQDIGCVSGCEDNNENARFIGRIKDKYRITMSISTLGNQIQGYYYYDSHGEKIALSGEGTDSFINLKTATGERFQGKIAGGMIEGVWNSADGKKSMSFKLYRSLM